MSIVYNYYFECKSNLNCGHNKQFSQKKMVISNILSIFAEIFDESLESEVGMGIRDEREKVKVRKEKLGGYFFSLSQLTFTGTGVGGFLPLLKGEATVGDVSVLIFGVLATAVFAGIANKILKY